MENSGPGGTFQDISAAGPGPTYTVQDSDEGYSIEAVATLQNDNGVRVSQTSAPTAAVQDASPYIWGDQPYPAIVQGEHLFGVSPQVNSLSNSIALAYVDTFNYTTNTTSYAATRNVELFDPFFLPSQHAPEVLNTTTVQTPARNFLIEPNISFSGTPSPEVIYVYKAQVNADGTGGNAIWQVTGTPDANGDGGVTFGTPVQIDSGSTGRLSSA